MIRTLTLAALAFAPLAAADWAIDADHSNALFRVQHMGAGYTYGRFDAISGDITYDEATPASDKVAITIQAASVSTHVPKMEEHLKSPDFFDAKQFPTLTFVSKSWSKTGEGQYDVAGDLTIHGVTKPVTVKVVRTGMGKHAFNQKDLVGFETTFSIKRADYGLSYGPGVVGEEVRVTLAVEGVKK